jgi:hypothetical protein
MYNVKKAGSVPRRAGRPIIDGQLSIRTGLTRQKRADGGKKATIVLANESDDLKGALNTSGDRDPMTGTIFSLIRQ